MPGVHSGNYAQNGKAQNLQKIYQNMPPRMFEYLMYFDIFIRACPRPFIGRRPAGGYWWLFHVVFLNLPVYGPLEFVAISFDYVRARIFIKAPVQR